MPPEPGVSMKAIGAFLPFPHLNESREALKQDPWHPAHLVAVKEYPG